MSKIKKVRGTASEIKKVRITHYEDVDGQRFATTQYEVDGQRFATETAAKYHIARQRFVTLVDECCWSDMGKEDVVRILWDENLALMVDIFKSTDVK